MTKKAKPGAKARKSQAPKSISVSPAFAKSDGRKQAASTPKKREIKQVKRSALPPSIATFTDLIEEIDSELQMICRRLRELVFETLPSAVETVYPALRLAMYKAPVKLCGIQPSKQQCHFYFTDGAQLSDRQRILRGDGNKIRHVPLRRLSDIPVDAIKELLKEAFLLSAREMDE